jgi:hypothetical protein
MKLYNGSHSQIFMFDGDEAVNGKKTERRNYAELE